MLYYLESNIKSRIMQCSALLPHFLSKLARSQFRMLATEKESAVSLWVKKMVCDLTLCPFAKPLIDRNLLLVKELPVSHGYLANDTEDIVIDAIMSEAASLCDPSYAYQSTLLILPGLVDFDEFLDLTNDVTKNLALYHLDKRIQIAHFHPRYIFEGSEANSPDNYTNRSPFPIVHLLRTCDVEDAVAQYKGHTDVIWRRNITVMRRLGVPRLKATLRSCHLEAAAVTSSRPAGRVSASEEQSVTSPSAGGTV
jgi:hypothetical protein